MPIFIDGFVSISASRPGTIQPAILIKATKNAFVELLKVIDRLSGKDPVSKSKVANRIAMTVSRLAGADRY